MEIRMARRFAAIAVAFSLGVATASAQNPPALPVVFTITTASANVHLGPSTGSAVIGHASRGAVLTVTRELGSWVKVAWPPSKDGVGYIHVSLGRIARRGLSEPGAVAPSSPTSTQSPAPTAAGARVAPPANAPQGAPMRTTYVRPPSHVVGVGALGALSGGSTLGAGFTVRTWPQDRFGIQVQASRFAFTSATAAGRTTSMQLTPAVLYAPKDRMSDAFWLRPYIGTGLTFQRQTLSDVLPGVSVADNSVGSRVFGGAELTFPSAPQFALSADVGYHWSTTPFVGFDAGGLALSLAGHWYFR